MIDCERCDTVVLNWKKVNSQRDFAVLGEDAVAEMLFIKRSMNPNDRWSGHVALPGGRQEENEALVETAKREALEEVGLDLSSSYEYSYLGSLDDRYTLPINARPFLISTHGTK